MSQRYRIREVDGPSASRILTSLHKATFQGGEPIPDWSNGYWWLCELLGKPVAFAGITQSTWHASACYLKRAGVLKAHTGRGLQRRLIRVRLAKARKLGYSLAITDCTANGAASANNLISAGFRVFCPAPWALPTSIYWKRRIA